MSLTHREMTYLPQSSEAEDVICYIWDARPPDSAHYTARQLEHVREALYAPVPKENSELPVIIFEDWSAVYFNAYHHRWEAISPPWVDGNVHRSRRQRLLREFLRSHHRASVDKELPF